MKEDWIEVLFKDIVYKISTNIENLAKVHKNGFKPFLWKVLIFRYL